MKNIRLIWGNALQKKRDILSFAIPVIGFGLLGYVFYTVYWSIPPVLNNVLFFMLIFTGLSSMLSCTQKYATIPLFVMYLVLFFVPIIWLRRGIEFDDNVLMGIFPFNDGMNYLTDAYRLLLGQGTMILYNGRPIFPGFLAFIMWLFGGNLQAALALLCVCASLSVFLLAVEVREIFGALAAGLTSTVLFYFAEGFLGRVNTENLGVILGALALALLLRGARFESPVYLTLGMFTLSIALNARPGALFVLPILLIWSWVNRKIYGIKLLFFLTVFMLVGFLINNSQTRLFAESDKTAFSNLGHSLYGLAAGYKGWEYIYAVHPELNNTSNVLPFALELIRENPFLLILGVFLNYKDYFSPDTMFYIMNFNEQQSLIGFILYIFMILGLFQLIRSRHTPVSSLLLFMSIGIFLSMAVIPYNDNGFRILMATNPVQALIIGLAFFRLEKRPPLGSRQAFIVLPPLYSVILGVALVIGPFLVAGFPLSIPPLPELGCDEGEEQISLMVVPGSYINVVKTGPDFGFIPKVKAGDIKIRLDNYYSRGYVPYDSLSAFPELERLVRRLKPGDTLLIGLNLLELNIENGPTKFVFLLTRTNTIELEEKVNHFCTKLATEGRLRNNRFYYDRSVLDNR
jgi:hypothetical protein